LPGRTAENADNALLEPLRRALSCVTNAELYVSPASSEDARALKMRVDPLRLQSSEVPGGLLLRLRQQFRSVRDPGAPRGERWHVSTVAYDYRINRADSGSELLSWHWHPTTGVPFPHLHVAADALSRRVHVPTGRVSIEAVVRMLLGELGVSPKRPKWEQVLAASERPFLKYRRWG
jgi:hypothetical protein